MYGPASPSIAAAAWRPCAAATSKCSTRSRRPWMTESYSHGSPAAQMPSAEVSSVCEQRTPPVSPSSRPDERASMTSGIAPVPEHHEVGVEHLARLGDHALHAALALEAHQRVGRHALDAVVAEHAARRSRRRPRRSGRTSGASSSITSVQCLPICVSEAATSQAM